MQQYLQWLLFGIIGTSDVIGAVIPLMDGFLCCIKQHPAVTTVDVMYMHWLAIDGVEMAGDQSSFRIGHLGYPSQDIQTAIG